MTDIVAWAIDQFYKKKDYKPFKNACHRDIDLPQELTQFIKLNQWVLESSYDRTIPSQEWLIRCGRYQKKEFEVSYKTTLLISKVVPLFYIQHEFELKNVDENRLFPYLKGDSGIAYSMDQFDIQEKIRSLLTQKRYQELLYRDMHEVVEEFKMPEDVTALGTQVTVELLLFRDILGICKKA